MTLAKHNQGRSPFRARAFQALVRRGLVCALLCVSPTSNAFEVSGEQSAASALPAGMLPQAAFLTQTFQDVAKSSGLPNPFPNKVSANDVVKTASKSDAPSTTSEDKDGDAKEKAKEKKSAPADDKKDGKGIASTGNVSNTAFSSSSTGSVVAAAKPTPAPTAAPNASPTADVPAATTSSSSSSSSLPISSNADVLKKRNDRLGGATSSLAGLGSKEADRAAKEKKDLPKEEKKEDQKNVDSLDRGANKARFGSGNELTLGNISDNRTPDPEDDAFSDLSDKFKKSEKELAEEKKKKEEEQRAELDKKIDELTSKPPPFTIQDYYNFRNLIAEREKLLDDVNERSPDFVARAREIYERFEGRDSEDSKKDPFRAFVERSRRDDGFQNPFIVAPTPDIRLAPSIH